ncbi:MAG: flagellar filament capping protein FliD [bacterium]
MATSSSGISFSGLFSGLDTESIITQLINLERLPIRLLEQKKTKLEYEKQDVQDVNNSLIALKNTIKTFAQGLLFYNDASSSDESILTATADASATEGTYDIDVVSLASKHIVRSSAKASAYTYPGANTTFQITIAGIGPFNIAVNNGDSLTQIASAINNATSGPDQFSDYGTAYVITDPVSGNQTLVIGSDETGTANDMTFTDDVAGPGGVLEELGIFDAADSIVDEDAAADAYITVNGVDVYSSTNTVTGAITGVTLNLKSTGAGVTVTVGVDDEDVVSTVKNFVDQFNKTTDLLASYITEEKIKDPETTEDLKPGVLRGDSDLVSTKSEIRIRTTGYRDSSLAYKILSDIGVESEPSSGSFVSDNITLDEDKLRSTLNTDREAVSDLLEGFAEDLDDYLDEQTKVSMAREFAGTYYRRILGIDDRIDAIDDDIETWEERIAAEEERLRTSFTLMEQMLSDLQTQSTYINTQLMNLLKSTSSLNDKK